MGLCSGPAVQRMRILLGNYPAWRLPLDGPKQGADGPPQQHSKQSQDSCPGPVYSHPREPAGGWFNRDPTSSWLEARRQSPSTCTSHSRTAMPPYRKRARTNQDIRKFMQQRYERVTVDAIVVGALGSWDPENDEILETAA